MKRINRREILKTSLSASLLTLTGKSSVARLFARSLWQGSRYDCIVIGAGMAGLAAARALHSKGAAVVIVEGRNRIGGRVWTAASTQGVPLDLGASWIEGVNGNPISALARRFNVPTAVTDFDNRLIYEAGGKKLDDAEIERIASGYQSALDQVGTFRSRLEKKDAPDISLGAGFDQVLANRALSRPKRATFDYSISTEIELDYGADVADLSLFQWDQDSEFGGDYVLFPGGYHQIVKGLARNLDIRLNQIVERIEYDRDGVTIITNQGEFKGERAIVTLPLGVLKRGEVTFVPPLPERKLAAIRRLGMGTLNKTYLRFPRVFWSKEHDRIGYVSARKGEWTEWLNVFKYSGQPILLAFNGGEYGRRIEQSSDRAIVDAAMRVLRTIHGGSIPEPEETLITRWTSDAFAGGSYSCIPPGASGRDYDALAEPVQNRIFFAGEATSRKYPATVPGAFLSGEREGQRIS
jgi:monoamine oxidase